MQGLSLVEAAERHHLAPKTLKAWHAAGLVSAVSVGRKGVTWLFDAATLDREVAALPRCSYSTEVSKGDEAFTRRCNRPVAAAGQGCHDHRLAVGIAGKPRPREIVEKSAAALRKHEDRDYYCEVCGGRLRERRGWKIAKRKAAGDGVLRCGSCGAKHRHGKQPIHAAAKAAAQANGKIATLDAIAAALPAELKCTGSAVLGHIRAGGLPAVREGWLHVVAEDQIPPYIEWLEHRRAEEQRKRSESLTLYITSPDARDHRERLREASPRLHAGVDAELMRSGYVPSKLTGKLLYRSRSLHDVLEPQRLQVGKLVRLGYNARAVYSMSNHPDARRKLGRALAVWNDTRDFGGRPRAAFSPEEDELIVTLRSVGWTWSDLTARVNEQRDPEHPARSWRPVSYGTVRRRFEELSAPTPAR